DPLSTSNISNCINDQVSTSLIFIPSPTLPFSCLRSSETRYSSVSLARLSPLLPSISSQTCLPWLEFPWVARVSCGESSRLTPVWINSLSCPSSPSFPSFRRPRHLSPQRSCSLSSCVCELWASSLSLLSSFPLSILPLVSPWESSLHPQSLFCSIMKALFYGDFCSVLWRLFAM
ncbi:hypothetical protein PMAYCL1PPCAC_29936, partial [Pristionchus mayeri]